MNKRISQERNYFALTEHNVVQVTIFCCLSIVFIIGVFTVCLPMLQMFFEGFLNSHVVSKTGEELSYRINNPNPTKYTHILTSWAVDMYKGSPEESRFWFNPVLSLIIQSVLIGVSLALLMSSLLPRSVGFVRQKIERELVNFVDRLCHKKFGYHTDKDSDRLIDEIKVATLPELFELQEEYDIVLDDLIYLQKGLKWLGGSLWYRMIHINDGIRVYMRFYFTVKHSNTVLGLVYMGAAVLIIIIGLRGIKFIPPTQPSLVLFALGLEFSLLITYAFTIMYSREEEEQENDRHEVSQAEFGLLSKDFGSSREIEKLLKVFIKSKK